MKVGGKARDNPDKLHDEDAAWVRRYLRLADAAVTEPLQHPRIFSMNHPRIGAGTRPATAPPHHAARTAERESEHPVSSELRKRRKAG